MVDGLIDGLGLIEAEAVIVGVTVTLADTLIVFEVVGLKEGVLEAVAVPVGVGLGGIINSALTATPCPIIEKSVVHCTYANGPLVITFVGIVFPLPLKIRVAADVRPSYISKKSQHDSVLNSLNVKEITRSAGADNVYEQYI